MNGIPWKLSPIRPTEGMMKKAISSTAAHLNIKGSALTVNLAKAEIRYVAMMDASPDFLLSEEFNDIMEQFSRKCEPELWAKIDKYAMDDDWNGATALNAKNFAITKAIERIGPFLVVLKEMEDAYRARNSGKAEGN